MVDERDEALRQSAANRGLKLVKSRRRKPGGDYGRYGLKEAATGAEVLGFGSDGLEATADEIEQHLRGLTMSTWKSSLGSSAAVARPKKKQAEPAPAKKEAKRKRKPEPAPEPEPTLKPEPEPKPEPELSIREAGRGDARALADLLQQAGAGASAGEVERRLACLFTANEPPLLAERGGIVGCAAWHVIPVLDRPRPVGRITMIAVAQEARGEGLGSALVAAAEARLRERGCCLVEASAGAAARFFRRQGYALSGETYEKELPARGR